MTHNQNESRKSRNNAAIAKRTDDKNVIMLYITQFTTTFELLKSFEGNSRWHDTVMSCQVECDQVNHHRLEVILFLSQVTFL